MTGKLNKNMTKEKSSGQSETNSAFMAKYDELSATSIAAEKKLKRGRCEAGRYTLEEAAKFIADNSKASADSILMKLRKASVWPYELKIYMPGSDEVYKPKRVDLWNNPAVTLKGDEETYAKDINNWLKEYETIIFESGCKFPEQNVQIKVGGTSSNTDNELMSSKEDALATEIDAILSKTPTLKPSKVKSKLRERVGKEDSSIVGSTSGGLKWERVNGDTVETTYANIDKRIGRWKSKNKSTA